MITKILLGYDDSEPAKRALALALDMARRYDAALDVLSVVRPPEFLSEKDSQQVIHNSRNIQRTMLQSLKPQVEAAGVEASFEVAVGSPGDQMLKHAEQQGVDLVIVGHSGKGLFEQLRMGSVSKQVMLYAHCPVLVVR